MDRCAAHARVQPCTCCVAHAALPTSDACADCLCLFVSQSCRSAADPELEEEYAAIRAAQQAARQLLGSPPQTQANKAKDIAAAALNGARGPAEGKVAPVGPMVAWLARACVQADKP